MDEIRERIGEIIAINSNRQFVVLPVFQMMRRYALFGIEYWLGCEKIVETINGGVVMYNGNGKNCTISDSGEILAIVSVNISSESE